MPEAGENTDVLACRHKIRTSRQAEGRRRGDQANLPSIRERVPMCPSVAGGVGCSDAEGDRKEHRREVTVTQSGCSTTVLVSVMARYRSTTPPFLEDNTLRSKARNSACVPGCQDTLALFSDQREVAVEL